MAPFVRSYVNKFILIIVDYVSKWVAAVAFSNNNVRSLARFLKRFIFSRLSTSWAIISDGSLYFCNNLFDSLLSKYG